MLIVHIQQCALLPTTTFCGSIDFVKKKPLQFAVCFLKEICDLLGDVLPYCPASCWGMALTQATRAPQSNKWRNFIFTRPLFEWFSENFENYPTRKKGVSATEPSDGRQSGVGILHYTTTSRTSDRVIKMCRGMCHPPHIQLLYTHSKKQNPAHKTRVSTILFRLLGNRARFSSWLFLSLYHEMWYFVRSR